MDDDEKELSSTVKAAAAAAEFDADNTLSSVTEEKLTRTLSAR